MFFLFEGLDQLSYILLLLLLLLRLVVLSYRLSSTRRICDCIIIESLNSR